MNIRECKICGKEFTVKTNAVCCSPECRKKNKNKLSKDSYEKSYHPKIKKRKSKLKSNREEIDALTVEAWKSGKLSYGQYVAKMYMEGRC